MNHLHHENGEDLLDDSDDSDRNSVANEEVDDNISNPRQGSSRDWKNDLQKKIENSAKSGQSTKPAFDDYDKFLQKNMKGKIFSYITYNCTFGEQ